MEAISRKRTMSPKSFFRNKHVKLAVPFLLFVVGGSIGLREFTALKYKYRAVETINLREEAKKIGVPVRKLEETTLEAQYELLKNQDIDNWENKRVPRPSSWGTE